MSKFKLRFVICPVIFVVAGSFLTQIRTLKAYGWVANLAVWLNLLVIFITMGVVANSPPNFAVATLGSAGDAVNPETITADPATGVYPPIINYNGLQSLIMALSVPSMACCLACWHMQALSFSWNS